MLNLIIIIFSIILGLIALSTFLITFFSIKKAVKIGKYTLSKLTKPLDTATLNQELSTFGFAYNPNDDIFFSTINAWQRLYGYGRPYDEIAPLLCLIFDCEPIVFKYNNKKWLIEFWKGQYGMTTGGEIGIYVLEDDNNPFNDIIYDSVADFELFPMSFVLRKKDNIIMTRNESHWWLTGFKLGEFSNPSDLVMDAGITFPNTEMRDSFVNSLRQTGYKNEDIRLENNTVYFTFDKPHGIQPLIRNNLVTYLAQKYNKRNCKLYNKYTKEYTNTLDKLNCIRRKAPLIYLQTLNFSRIIQLLRTNIG